MADREFFVEGVQVYETGSEEWFVEGLQVHEDQADAAATTPIPVFLNQYRQRVA